MRTTKSFTDDEEKYDSITFTTFLPDEIAKISLSISRSVFFLSLSVSLLDFFLLFGGGLIDITLRIFVKKKLRFVTLARSLSLSLYDDDNAYFVVLAQQ